MVCTIISQFLLLWSGERGGRVGGGGGHRIRSMFEEGTEERCAFRACSQEIRQTFKYTRLGKRKVWVMIQSHLITFERKLLGHVLYGMTRNVGQEDREIGDSLCSKWEM